MEKRILSEINRVLELMSVNKKVIVEAVGPGSILSKIFGEAADYIISKLGQGEAEAFEKALGTAITDAGKTAETLTSKELGQIMSKAEFVTLRKLGGEAYVSLQKEAIGAILSKYDLSVALEAKKAYAELVNGLGINKAFVKDTLVAYKEVGGSFAKASETGTEAGIKAGTSDAEKIAAKKAEEEALAKAEEKAKQEALANIDRWIEASINTLKQDKNFAKIFKEHPEDVERLISESKQQLIDFIAKNPSPQAAMDEIEKLLVQVEAMYPKIAKEGRFKKIVQGLKDSFGVKYAKPTIDDGKIIQPIDFMKTVKTNTGGFFGILLVLFATAGALTIVVNIVKNSRRKDTPWYKDIFEGWLSGTYNVVVMGVETVFEKVFGSINSNKVTGGETKRPAPAPTPNTNPDAKYANSLDGFKAYAKDKGVEATNAVSLSGGIYKTNTDAIVEYKWVEKDTTSHLGTFEAQ